MNTRSKTYLQLLISPVVVVLIVSIALIAINLYIVHGTRPYNSDDVSWQNILLTWRPFNGYEAFLGGSDNFIVKAPLFALFGYFFSPSRKLLFLESTIFAATTFTLFYFSSIYFLNKLRIKLTYINLMPFVWFASFGYFISRLYLNPILRNIELGLSFVVFVLAAKIYYQEIEPLKSLKNKMITLLSSIVLGLFIYNDPYFLYFTIGPIVILFITLFILRKVQKTKLLLILGISFLSIIFSKILSLIAIKAGITLLFKTPAQFVSFDSLASNISFAVQGTLRLFGADFFNKVVASLVSVSAITNFFILTFILYSTWIIFRKIIKGRLKYDSTILWSTFFAFLSLFVLFVYTLSNLAVDIETYRYLIMMAFSSVLFLTITLAKNSTKVQTFFVGVIVLATILNMGSALASRKSALSLQPGAIGNNANTLNFQIINTINAEQIVKGYAPYWDGNINTYLSGGNVQFLAISCFGTKTATLEFLVDQSRFSENAKKSFYMEDPALNNPATCTPQQVLEQFGQPKKILQIADKKLWIYDYDIGVKM